MKNEMNFIGALLILSGLIIMIIFKSLIPLNWVVIGILFILFSKEEQKLERRKDSKI